MFKRFICLCLGLCLFLGAASPALAAPQTADQLAISLGSGWYSSSDGFSPSFNYDLANSFYRQFYSSMGLWNKKIIHSLTGSTTTSTSDTTTLFSLINGIYNLLSSSSSGSFLYLLNSNSSLLSNIYTSLGSGSSTNNVLSYLATISNKSSIDPFVEKIYNSLGYSSSTLKTDIGSLNNSVLGLSSPLNSIDSYTSNLPSLLSYFNSGSLAQYTNYPRRNFFDYTVNGLNINPPVVDNFTGLSRIYYFSQGDRVFPVNNNSGVDSFQGAVGLINNNLVNFAGFLRTFNSTYPKLLYNSVSNAVEVYATEEGTIPYYMSVMDVLTEYLRSFELYVGKLQFVLADDSLIAARKANSDQRDFVLDSFTGSGSSSASKDDFSSVSDSVGAFKDSLSGGGSFSDTFTFLDGSSNAWLWFTNEVKSDLDQTSGGASRRVRRSSSDTPLLDEYYQFIYDFLGGGS